MSIRDHMTWFKKHFHRAIIPAVEGTPYDLDLMTALAYQETGELWGNLRKKPGFSVAEITALCAGDTLDAPNRSAFPKTKSALVRVKDGEAMFQIARKALENMANATRIGPYLNVLNNPRKFAHGYGIWQYDLQFFKVDPKYFLEKRYEKLENTLAKAIGELKVSQGRAGYGGRTTLTDLQKAHVAIAYNTGRFRAGRGLKQGHRPRGGRFYGENIYDYIVLAKTIPVPGRGADIPVPEPGSVPTPPADPIEATGALLVVDTMISTLNLRSEPKRSSPPRKNVIADLPDGHPVRAVSAKTTNGFREVEASLDGATFRGFAHSDFLKRAPAGTEIEIVTPAEEAPKSGIVAVYMPRRSGTVTRRTAMANAHSLNERNQPGRKGTTSAELVGDVENIISWLAVEKTSHKRYRRRGNTTFCNIYTHDFCHLAGAYLPRVWWTGSAIEALAQNRTVEPRYGDTIREMRANDLFRWLRDFGPRFGWRQAASLDDLQVHANRGGLSVIVARRTHENRSGHILMVVPETDRVKARRTRSGDRITSPVQSQAGHSNFRRRSNLSQWWLDDKFAESAFWIHP